MRDEGYRRLRCVGVLGVVGDDVAELVDTRLDSCQAGQDLTNVRRRPLLEERRGRPATKLPQMLKRALVT